jgi:RNA polymerase sigma-70 factor (sigma-E family)
VGTMGCGGGTNRGAGATGARELAGPAGFDEVAGSARPSLVRAAQGVTRRRDDAEDAVQASLLKAMAAWPRVANQERWRQQAYVRQIVVNTCRSGWRKWGSRVVLGDMPDLAQQPKTDVVEDRVLVRAALERLPQRQRQVLVLRYWHDLSEAEIAERLGCAPGTVKSSAARGLRALRDMLPELGIPGTAIEPAAAATNGPRAGTGTTVAGAGAPAEGEGSLLSA